MMGAVGEKRGPLSGIRVLDLSRVLAGPFCTMILGDLGAEIIKIEAPGTGDQTRTIPPFVNGVSHYFFAINRNKKSVALDARQPEGRDLILKLAESCDVVVENFRPGVMERLGLGSDVLHRRRPALVICSISGFGQKGSMHAKASFDLISQALSGVMSINGEPDGPPTKLGIPMGDIAGGLWGAISVLAGLQHRNATGEGINVDLSLLEGLMGLLGYLGEIYLMTGETPGRVGSQHHSVVPYGRYPVKDGHMVLAIHVGSFWRKFCAAIGRTDLAADPRFQTTADRQTNRAELEPLISAILRERTREEWQKLFDEADVPVAPVLDVGEALTQPVVRERGFVVNVDHPVAGKTPLAARPMVFPGTFDRGSYSPAPALGQHTREVLRTLANLDDVDINRLVQAGVAEEQETNRAERSSDATMERQGLA